MSSSFLTPPGTRIDVDALAVPKAVELANALRRRSIDFAELVETLEADDREVVVFDVEVELPQVRIHPIERLERVAAVFPLADNASPEVLALREDFPRVPHLNLRDQELPRSLCLYEETYRDLKRRWTAARFVARVREWLALTAKGSLHQEDQPLEPILMHTDGILLIPADAFSSKPSEKPFGIISLRSPVGRDGSVRVLPFYLECPPREHGVIHRRPQTLADLAEMLATEGVDLLSKLRTWVRGEFKNAEEFLSANLVLLISFPRTRVADGLVERPNLFAFQTRLQADEGSIAAPIGVVGESIGVLDQLSGKRFLSAHLDESKRGEDVLIEILNPHFGMTPKTLADQNGLDLVTEERLLCAVGVGALGSQVVMNLARAGFGRWTLIDYDLLLPHNVARHVLSGHFVGKFKCQAVALLANSLSDGEDVFEAIPASIFTDGGHQSDVQEALDSADVILDMSASVSVARHLASAEGRTGRCLSVFMSPTGADLVLLAEDEDRLLPLDELEMQYYRACVRDERLTGHLAASQSRLRYGQSCRDLTSQMPQRLVALHAGIAATAIPSILAKPDARVAVWRSLEDGSVSCVEVATSEAIRLPIGDWTVVTDDGLLSKLHGLRQKKLPNETGGVLLGSFDLDRHVVYIVDTIPSPPDSEEWPRLYVRGRDGLQPQVDQVKIATDGMLEYIGEWHSHPSGVLPIPSTADQAVFAWITELTDAEGLPAVMMIVGDVGRVSCFVDEIAVRESLLPYGGAA